MAQSQSDETSKQKIQRAEMQVEAWPGQVDTETEAFCSPHLQKSASDSNKTFRRPHIAPSESSKQMGLSVTISLQSIY